MPLTSRGFPLLLTFDLDGETMWTSRDATAATMTLRELLGSAHTAHLKRPPPPGLDLGDL